MKIKEIEVLTNMSRDNIRFYEKCGLLEPHRNENGYREYSEDDVKILKRIQLLRSLHLSIDDIKDIQCNKIELVNCLDEHIKLLEEDKIDLDKSMNTCRQMILDQVKYDELDASKYLQSYDGNELNEDVIPRLKAPIRRYVARSIDLNLYNLIINCFTVFILNARSSENVGVQIVEITFTLLFMLLIEPFLLSKFGTTFGKWLLGLKITDEDGNYLTYKNAFDRTLNVIIYGYGCSVPIIFTICCFVSYRKNKKNEELIWEEGNIETSCDIQPIHIISTVIISIVYLVIAVLLSIYSLLPPNRKELSVSEFAQNYNFIQNIFDESSSIFLDNEGNWYSKQMSDGFLIAPGYLERYPQLNYVIRNDEVVEISFSIENESDLFKRDYFRKIRNYIIVSYLKSQESYSIFTTEAEKIAMMFNSHNDEDLEYEAYGVEMIQKVKIEHIENTLYESISFIIRKK